MNDDIPLAKRDTLPDALKSAKGPVTFDIRFRVRCYDQHRMEVASECIVPLTHTVKLVDLTLSSGPSIAAADGLFVSNGFGFDLRYFSGVHIYMHVPHGMTHVDPFQAEFMCIKDGILTLPIDPPDRGYLMVNALIGISFDFIGASGERLNPSWEP